MFDITEFRANFQNDGARPTQFQVDLFNPIDPSGDLKAPFLIQAASLPPSNLGTIQVAYFGRRIKMPGDRTFPSWTIQVLNDEDFLIRNALENWSNRINTLKSNVRATGSSSFLDYVSSARVSQMDKTGKKILRTYQFENLWPSNIDPIDVNWSASDSIESFNVTFNYDFHTVIGGQTGIITGEA